LREKLIIMLEMSEPLLKIMDAGFLLVGYFLGKKIICAYVLDNNGLEREAGSNSPLCESAATRRDDSSLS